MRIGHVINQVLAADAVKSGILVELIAGLRNPAQAEVGAQVLSLFLMGWALQHYYLDGKIWRVSKDSEVAEYLKV